MAAIPTPAQPATIDGTTAAAPCLMVEKPRQRSHSVLPLTFTRISISASPGVMRNRRSILRATLRSLRPIVLSQSQWRVSKADTGRSKSSS